MRVATIMKTCWRSAACAVVLAVGGLGLGATPAKAQAFGLSIARPGFALGVSSGYPGYYGGYYPGYYPGYPVVAPGPVVVPPPVIVPRPYVVARPYYYGGYYRPYHAHRRYYYR
jgi:hypothetical protein